LLLNPRYGRIGLIAYPYFFFFEMLGPIIEFFGYIVFFFLLITGYLSTAFAVLFLWIAVLMGSVLSVAAVGLEELSFRRYTRLQDLLFLLVLSLLENFGYRQLITFYRIRGTISYLRGQTGWGSMERKGFQKS